MKIRLSFTVVSAPLSLDPPMRFVVSVDEYFGIGLVRDRLISPMT
jgi:hypothetical protein